MDEYALPVHGGGLACWVNRCEVLCEKQTIIMDVAACLTMGLSWFVFPFIYNKIYARGLLEKGYLPADEGASNLLASRGIMMASAETTASEQIDE